jgi:glycolate oxidase
MFESLKNMDVELSEEIVDRLVYGSDASRLRGNVLSVIWPKNEEEIHKIILYCRRHNINVVVRGGGSSLSGGSVANDSIVLDMSKMKRIGVNYNEKFALVDAGVVLDELNSKLKNLYLPIIPDSHSVCTIGGMIATNAAGFRSLRFGRMEDYVEELEVVEGGAKFLKLSRKEEIENFIGNEGVTGVIVRAKIKLVEPVEIGSVSILSYDSITKLCENVQELKLNEDLNALEFLDEYASEFLGLESRNHLIVEYGDNKGDIKDAKEIKEIFNLRENAYWSLISKGYGIIEDPKIPVDKIGKFLYWLRKNHIPSTGHLGVNVIHPFLKDRSKFKEMFDVVKLLGGSFGGEHGIGIVKKDYADSNYIYKIRKLKEKHDPGNIMNRGKIV